jgi:hypothetical protein
MYWWAARFSIMVTTLVSPAFIILISGDVG